MSSNSAQVPADRITITGTGATRTVRIEPATADRINGAALTFTARDPDGNTGQVQVQYYASLAVASPTATYYYGDADASAAVDAGDGYILVADDEHEIIKLYKAGQSGNPVKEYDFAAVPGGRELDIESAARVGDLVYWIGSYGNNRDGESRVERQTTFTTTVTGSGANTELTLASVLPATPSSLFSALLAWDSGNGHGLGANRLKFVAGARSGVQPNPPNGFNIEGFAFAPGSTSTAYLSFRAPSITVDGTERALIVPVTNFDTLVAGTAPQPQFGAPILLDLGGRTIRDIRKNAHDEYLISAGPGLGNDTWALYMWNGDPAAAPVFNQVLPTIDARVGGAWEAISIMPDRIAGGAKVEIVSDTGDAPLYGPTAAKDLARPIRKAYTDTFTIADFLAATVTATPRCLAGKAYVAVQARNDHDSPMSIDLKTAYGERSVANVAPGANAYQSFTTRAASVAAGSATVRATGTVDGKAVTTVYTVQYAGLNCAG
ncbi:hypothetical protein ACFQ1L_31925 [Phytohabitans flavus]|uniref:hypothetical protein n=1 Tax=Phytohabitans flavus TaxID=1076124 RepID=UPI0036334CDC